MYTNTLQIVILVIFIILMIAVIGLAVKASKQNSHNSQSERNAMRKGIITWLFTDSILFGWLVYRKNKSDERL